MPELCFRTYPSIPDAKWWADLLKPRHAGGDNMPFIDLDQDPTDAMDRSFYGVLVADNPASALLVVTDQAGGVHWRVRAKEGEDFASIIEWLQFVLKDAWHPVLTGRVVVAQYGLAPHHHELFPTKEVLGGVAMEGIPGDPVTGEMGTFTLHVPAGWAGVVTPVKKDYTFYPATKVFSSVIRSRGEEDWFAVFSPVPVSTAVVEETPVTPIVAPVDGDE